MADVNTPEVGAVFRGLQDNLDGLEPLLREFSAVAAKTKLLGFNASILAAQAGSEGRSFAVVAEQMKALNQRATVATGQLGAQLERLQRSARELHAALAGQQAGDAPLPLAEPSAMVASTDVAVAPALAEAIAGAAPSPQAASGGPQDVSTATNEAQAQLPIG